MTQPTDVFEKFIKFHEARLGRPLAPDELSRVTFAFFTNENPRGLLMRLRIALRGDNSN